MTKRTHGVFHRGFISAIVSHSCGKKTGCTIGSWLALGFCPGIKASSGFLQRMNISIACTRKHLTAPDFCSPMINSLERFGYFKRSWKDFLSPVVEKNLTPTTDRAVKLLSGRPLQKKMCPWKLKNSESILPTKESEVEQKKKEKKKTHLILWKSFRETHTSPHVRQCQAYSALCTHKLSMRSKYKPRFMDTERIKKNHLVFSDSYWRHIHLHNRNTALVYLLQMELDKLIL